MKELLSLVAAVVIGTLLALVLTPEDGTVLAFSLTNLQGKPVSDVDLRDKVSFINFQFPSYPGCVSEIPRVIKMAKDYRGRDLQVFGIAQPIDPSESVNQYVREYGLPFIVMFDGDKAAAQVFDAQVYPISFLINRKGEILKTLVSEPDFTAFYQGIDRELTK